MTFTDMNGNVTTGSPGNLTSTRRRNRALMVLASLCVLSYAPAVLAVFLGGWPFTDDAISLMSVWREYGRQALHTGILPLWNPNLFCGTPFMSNGQTAIFYPPNIMYWTLPMLPALLLDAIGHSIILAFGIYGLARALGLSRTASWLGAVALSLGGSVSAHIYTGHMTWHAARAYIPWEMLALLLYLRSGRKRYAVLLAVLFTLQSASGYPPLVLLGAGLCCGLLFAWIVSHWKQGGQLPRGWIAAALLTVFLTAALAAVQILPLKEASNLSVHGSGLKYEEAVELSGSWRSLVRLLLPNFFGGNGRVQWSIIYGAPEEAAYTGLFTLLLAVFSPWLAMRRTPDQNFLAALPRALPWLWCLLPISAVMAMGDNTPLYRWLFDHVPMLRLLRIPVRWLEVWTIAAALLAGFAFDGCIHRARSSSYHRVLMLQRMHWLLAALCALLCLGLFLLPPTSQWWMRTALWNVGVTTLGTNSTHSHIADFLHSIALSETLVATLILCLAAWLLSRYRSNMLSLGRARPFVFLLLGLVACDLIFLFWRSARTIPAGTSQHYATWPREITRHYERSQRWDTGMGWLTLNRGILHGIDLYNGYDALSSKRYFDFASAAEGRHFWLDMYQPAKHPPLLRVASLTHTLSTIIEPARTAQGPQLQAQSGEWKLWKHEGAWPRVYLTRRLFRASEAKQLGLLAKLSKTDFINNGKPVVVTPANFTSVAVSPVTTRDQVQRWSRSWNSMTVEASAVAPSLLVQSETLYPGWRAWVNGEPAKLATANFLFRGVSVPAGQSRVVVVYDTQTFRFAMFLTLCGIGALTAMSVSFIRRGSGVLRPRPRPR